MRPGYEMRDGKMRKKQAAPVKKAKKPSVRLVKTDKPAKAKKAQKPE